VGASLETLGEGVCFPIPPYLELDGEALDLPREEGPAHSPRPRHPPALRPQERRPSPARPGGSRRDRAPGPADHRLALAGLGL